ncbi:MAG: CdiI family contact-dependent growth inhibition immunity protein [Campylobacteraceae bacterium]|jgi:hypothetical protein|nr:CdiI family contact-dependent growth inhibition immunity protein [Campylobacteraceae bacterium]
MFDLFKKLFIKKHKIEMGDNILKFNENQDYKVNAFINNEFLLIETMSGLGLAKKDYDVPNQILSIDADNKSIGESILLALSKSRTITREEYASFFNLETNKKQYEEWEKNLMQKFGYKTKKALYRKMNNCWIRLKNGTIEISPSNHEKLKGWSGIRNADVILSLDNSSEEIGVGLRLAFSRCIGLDEI